MSKTDKSLPSNKFIKLVGKLSRNQTSLLLQLPTGHAPLNKHLHHIGKVELLICPTCNLEDETVHHFIITCPARDEIRRKMLSTLGRDARSLQTLLTALQATPHLLAYVKATGKGAPEMDSRTGVGQPQALKKKNGHLNNSPSKHRSEGIWLIF
jgi:hypothetical protein